jgi:glutamine---fructose-6-phosphate transaminase (isomerizing)
VRHCRYSRPDAGCPLLVDALKRLEYRGYDSAGVATLEGGQLTRRRAEGKLRNLEEKLGRSPLSGRPASATPAGRPMARRPRTTPIRMPPRLALVHNGIIENFRELRTSSTAPASSSTPTPTPKSWRISSTQPRRRA